MYFYKICIVDLPVHVKFEEWGHVFMYDGIGCMINVLLDWRGDSSLCVRVRQHALYCNLLVYRRLIHLCACQYRFRRHYIVILEGCTIFVHVSMSCVVMYRYTGRLCNFCACQYGLHCSLHVQDWTGDSGF